MRLTGINSNFDILLSLSYCAALTALILVSSLCKAIFSFLATDELQKCKYSLTIREANPLYKTEFDHNENITYKCRGKLKQKHSTCINGRWDPELTCTGKLLFIVLSKSYSIYAELAKAVFRHLLNMFSYLLLQITLKPEGNLETNQNIISRY